LLRSLPSSSPTRRSSDLGPKHLVVRVTRARLESLVEALVERSLEPCKVALADAGLSANEVSDVILVGGQTRMPTHKDHIGYFVRSEEHTSELQSRFDLVC